MKEEWINFNKGDWCNDINVSDFIKCNYTPYEGDEIFLAKITSKTKKIKETFEKLYNEESKKHVLDIDTVNMSGINSFEAGYICSDDDVIVGLQTDAPKGL